MVVSVQDRFIIELLYTQVSFVNDELPWPVVSKPANGSLCSEAATWCTFFQ